ncbi:amidohydrolase family protein [Microvirga alba]|uniref:Amidohydrolase n=1 Tax=Microvirga alba TaxID=2791025 RepID=A0A931BZ74_9HYPH|nr:amidohydrolase family protein [Microvirga alba]MBF9235502.1 amidohydrolase [Microvirga alba]
MLIDFRTRPITPEYMALVSGPSRALNWRRWGLPVPNPEPLENFFEHLKKAGVDIGVFTGRQSTTLGEMTFGVSNDYVASCAAASSGRLLGVAGIDISDQAFALEEMERCVRELGLKGISIDPGRAKVFVDDRSVYPIYEKAAELGVPVIITMGPFVGKYGDPSTVDAPAADLPGTNFVCSHACWPQATEFLALAYRRTNVFIEPSIYWNLPGAFPVFEAANGLLQDQIIYASAYPFSTLESIDSFKAQIEWDEGAWRKVSFSNAAALLGISDDH